MRRFHLLVILVIASLSACGSAAADPASAPVGDKTDRQRYALLVGVNTYEDRFITPLICARADATLLAETLIGVGGLPKEHVLVLTDDAVGQKRATRENILAAVQTFLKPRVKPDDEVIVFLSGHGMAKGAGENARSFYLPCDVHGSTLEALTRTAVDIRDLTRQLSDLGASQYVLMVDACRNDPVAGRGDKDNLLSDVMSRDLQVSARAGPREQTRSVVTVTLSSCKIGERSYEDPARGHGIFTQYLVEGIRSGVPQPPEGAVEVGRLADYVRRNVGDWARQQQHDFVQTPTLTAAEISAPVILVRSSATAPQTAFAASGQTSATIRTVPEACEVLVDGTNVGVTPITVPLSAGDHAVTVSKTGFKPQQWRLTAMSGFTQTFPILLPPEEATSSSALQRYLDAAQDEARGRVQTAILGYGAATEEDPKFAEAWYRQGVGFTRRGRSSDAVEALKKAVALKSNEARYHAALALAWLSASGKGDSPTPRREAQREAETALRADPLSLEATRAHAEIALFNGKNKQAVEELAATVARVRKDAALHHALAIALARLEAYDKAIAEFNEALALYPSYYEAHRDLAFVLHRAGRKDDALKEYEQAASLRGSANDGDEVAGLDVAMSAILLEKGKREAALGYRDDAIEIQPDVKKIALALAIGQVIQLIPQIPGVGKLTSIIPPGMLPGLPGGVDPFANAFDPKWRNSHVMWDFRHHDLVCHDASATPIFEERKRLSGSDGAGNPINIEFRILTYKCDTGKHEVKVWVDGNSNRVREVSCHGKIATDRGYSRSHNGNAVDCADRHTLYLIGGILHL